MSKNPPFSCVTRLVKVYFMLERPTARMLPATPNGLALRLSMVFKHGGKAYAGAEAKAYRTRDLDVVIVTAPPNHRWVYVVDCAGVHLADASETQSLAEQYGVEELRKTRRKKAASAA